MIYLYIPEDGLVGVERYVEAGYARVGGGEVAVARRTDRHRRHRLEAVLRRRQRGGSCKARGEQFASKPLVLYVYSRFHSPENPGPLRINNKIHLCLKVKTRRPSDFNDNVTGKRYGSMVSY